MLYSKSAGGFFSREIHGDGIPDDAVEIGAELHRELLEGQEAGLKITADVDGRPFLAHPNKPPRKDAIASLSRGVQGMLDAAARSRGYDSIASAISYADEPAVAGYQAEGIAFRAWRSMVWQAFYAEMGDGDPPSLTDVLAALPDLAKA